ncbi:toll/interleukin-1 receptor domain-containing protein [Roseomonas sp. CAU 1739]|uniref:toll/interleukin-1 receptor domain-containing protein n=1 Tax=Roseomonas sp. CAU 1739 TaxID=3140364 RepID=UPI00325BC2A7
MATIFFSYSHADEALRDQLEKHLSALKHEGLVDTWHDRRIPAGDVLDDAISVELERADVILLLVSADFLASNYCYNIEMRRAVERHEAREARVIPVILRPCDWHGTPFGKLAATPDDGRPVRSFADIDEGLLQVVRATRRALPPRSSAKPPARQSPIRRPQPQKPIGPAPRSSNLGLPRRFTDIDRDRFRDESFEFLAVFFENSLQELAQRHPGVDGRFKRIDAEAFTAAIYRDGTKRTSCHIFLATMPDGIAYSAAESQARNSYNEILNIEADDHNLYWRPIGMNIHVDDAARLTPQAAAEAYWDLFLQDLRR